MPYAKQTYTGNGTQQAFPLGFTFITSAHVRVYVNGIPQTTGYTVSNGNVNFTVAPAVGAQIVIRRESSRTARLVNYQNSNLTPSTLNRDSTQAFNLAQEAFDSAEDAQSTALTAQGAAADAQATANEALQLAQSGGGNGALPLEVSLLDPTSVLPTSFTLSMSVAGVPPLGSSMRLEWTDSPTTGPWRASPQAGAALGIFTRDFTGAPSNTRIYYRGVVYSVVPPTSGSLTDGNGEVVHAVTATQSFLTPAAGSALTLTNGTPANVTATGFRLSVTVAGTIPTGAVTMIQWTDNPANGPWRESARVATVAGVFTHDFTNAPANTQITWRAFVFNEPATIHAQSPNATFNTPAAGTPTNYSFLFIGDSLFTGSGDSTYLSPRGDFQSVLTAAGVTHTMIGPYTHGFGGGPQPNHGASGGRAIDSAASANNVRDNLNTILGASYNPDFIALHVGWNDLFVGGTAATTAPDRYQALYDDIRTRKPSAKILLHTLSQPDEPFPYADATYVALNNRIRSIATANPTTTALVDLALIQFAAGDLYDYVHYAQGAAAKVAQATYSTLTTAGWIAGGSAPDSTLMATLIDHMGAQQLNLNSLPQNAGWRLGASIVKGGDLRAIANPAWWNFNPRTDLGDYWRYLLPWTVVWDIVGHQNNLNTRYAERNVESWVLHDDDNQWTRLSVHPTPGGDAFERNMLNPLVGNLDQRIEADGSSSVRFGPQSQYVWHGYGTWGSTPRPERVRAVLARAQVRKILHNQAGTDDRNLARYAVHVGIDAYPGIGNPQTFGWPYNPGCGVGRFVEVTNDWRWVYFVTLASPPTFNVDTGYAFNERQTITQALLAANLPPL